MKLTDIVQDFHMANQANGFTRATLRWYKSILLRFTDAYPDRELESFTVRDLREYLVTLRNQTTHFNCYQRVEQEGGFSDETINDHTRCLHRFWKWCALEYMIPNPMGKISYPRQPSPHPKPIAPEDIEKLFRATTDDATGIRNRAIIAMLTDTGCRAGGLVGLKMENIYWETKIAIVTEKGNKTRAIIFTELALEFIQDWVAVREPFPYLFYNLQTGEALTPNGLYLLMKRLGAKAGVERFNPHSFRHTFARGYIKNGGDMATLAKILGHDDIRTTARHYAIFTSDEIVEKHERLSPSRILAKYRRQK